MNDANLDMRWPMRVLARMKQQSIRPGLRQIKTAGTCWHVGIVLSAVLLVSACAMRPLPPPSAEQGGDRIESAAPGIPKNRVSPGTAGSEPTVESAVATAKGEVQNEAGNRDVSSIDRDNNVFFALGSAAIDDLGRSVIRRHAAMLKANPKLTVTLVGYTDNLGSREYNIALAQKRVAVGERELRAQGVPARQIRRLSYGYEKAQPQSCTSDACRQNLRRVELRYSD